MTEKTTPSAAPAGVATDVEPATEPGGDQSVRDRTGVVLTAAAVAFLLLVAVVVALAVTTRGAPAPPPPEPAATNSPQAPGIAVVPLQKIDLPDPMIVTAGGQYHLYISTAFGDPSRANVPEEIGAPGRWGPLMDAMPRVPVWARGGARGGKVWDPYVQKIGGRWLLYFSAELNGPSRGTGPTHCLGVAQSGTAAGPFVPVGSRPIVCQPERGGDIDIQPFYDTDGPNGPSHPWYIVWKSDDNNLKPPRPTAIWAAPLSNDGLTLTGPGRIIYRADLAWQKPVLEAPQMVRSPDGRVWLFYSAGRGFHTGEYGMGVAYCDGPLGGCRDVGTGPLISSNRQGSGPGEETVFIGPDRSYWLLYNPWHTGILYNWDRPAEGVRIGWGPAGPYVADAGRFPAP